MMSIYKFRPRQQAKYVVRMTCLLLIAFFSSLYAEAQEGGERVSGRVLDEQGAAIGGVSVRNGDGSSSTSTDDQGRFSIQLSTDRVLRFVYVGYAAREITVGKTDRELRVTMVTETSALDEVVVVGYGTQRRQDVTGAIASVDSKILREIPAASMTQALQGRVAGVNISQTSTRPGAGMQIRIRGSRSLLAANDPLIVLDGIPFAGSLADINPSDIRSVDVLKDASASAIYGSRAANGVILVTTFRGSTGGIRVTYNGFYGLKKVAEKYQVFNGEEFAQLRDVAGYTQYLPQEQEMMEAGKSTDWQDVMYKDGRVTDQNLSIAGGNDKGQYSVGLGYYDESTVLPGQEYSRYSLRFATDLELSRYIKVGLSTQNSYSITKGEGASLMYQMLTLSPLAPTHNADGSIYMQPSYPTDEYFNPLLINQPDAWAQDRNRFNSFNSLYGEIRFTDYLKWRTNVGLTYTQNNYGHFNSSKTPFRNGNPSEARVTFQPGTSWTIENLLYYEQTIAEKHKLNAVAMVSAEENESHEFRADALDMMADFMLYYNLGYYKEGTGNIAIPAGNQWYNKRALQSLMARINYGYDDRYLLTATLRRDGSSVLAPGHKWKTYFALSSGWNIMNEQFMENQRAFSNLKLRVGFGQTASQAINPYQTLGSLSQNRYNFGDENAFGYYVNNLANPSLTWEPTNTWNIGLDFGILENRFSGSIEWYTQDSHDLLYDRSLPPTSGVPGRVVVNEGRTRNSGMEFTLSSDIIRPSDDTGFSWQIDANLTFNRNKVLALSSGLTADEGRGYFVGHPINVIFNYSKVGIWQLDEAGEAASYGFRPGQVKLLDYNNDGRIDANDRHVSGRLDPDFEGGITNRMGYKNFDFTVVGFFRVGGTLISQIHQGNSYTNMLQGRRNQIKVDYWTPWNPTNEYPMPDGSNDQPAGNYGSTLGFYDAGFLKIRTISLGYSFNESITQRLGINAFRLYSTVQNPFVFFSDYMKRGGGVDPEGTNLGNSGYTGGAGGVQARHIVAGLNTPPTRGFLLGLNVTF
ncbi:TonB-dependent receptor [Sphingobacterium sp. DN00404]|uniref:TonB-dependent receptor n=1 Tax=Sphingobacterium micropteri TaxID=2763501 RepID=A0ABR7YNP5_9SPHI|nr:TonB-dependent receptor [Sphingobacterium micropteri]MBD1432968.1 TonB-dependent receptor [Sphingobacterium micropteri]